MLSLISAAVVELTPITSLVVVVKANVLPRRGLIVTPVPAVRLALKSTTVPIAGAPVIVQVSVGAAPWKSTYIGAQIPSGPVKFVLGGSGHIAGIVNPPAANKYGYWTNDELPEDSDAFLEGATHNPGSWWLDWQEWVTGQTNGDKKVAARKPGSGALKVIEDAPGSFVKFRLDTQKKVAK